MTRLSGTTGSPPCARSRRENALSPGEWDPVEIAARIGDTLQTTLTVYAHEFDVRRRGDQRRKAFEARYDTGMATHEPQQTATNEAGGVVDIAPVQAVRDRGR